ncbi:hypothetical protein ASPWEDRAFT_168723 [Aspergillus wentii DTO 134E9]|uniref:Uncharacterized protein n=1 Tax=Aspergillus wentii DTO 134E9 TaxID=1073089 RepID=A0A1L9RV90_ASPWE|nr:uncharacterized protein ASPWEDRAFT_168723 [Aspergillus wentii DTO 134E9]OJJ38846.1 hypothetical protein ASPWEDRAFT_168723 [Aspergillus wentii DTO 134E9]
MAPKRRHIQKGSREAYFGTIAIRIDELDVTNNPSQAIDQEDVDEAVENLAMGACRFHKDTRMRASLSEKDFETVPETWYISGRISGGTTVNVTLDDIRRKLMNTEGVVLGDFIHLKKWPGNCEKEALLSGHSWRIALQRILADQQKAAEAGDTSPDGSKVTVPSEDAFFWTVDMFESSKIHTGGPDSILQTNHCDFNKQEIDGYHFLRITKACKGKSAKFQKDIFKKSWFTPWVQNELGVHIPPSRVSRVLAIVNSECWRAIWEKYLETAYGSIGFNFTFGEWLVNAKFDELWELEFNKIFEFQRLVFRGFTMKVSARDWGCLIDFTKEDYSAETFGLLFYPTKKDYIEGTLVGTHLELSHKWFTVWSLPKLQTAQSYGDKIFLTRRPGFLSKLTDEDYRHSFHSLLDNPGISCPSWDDFLKLEKFVGQPTKRVLQHMVWWTDQSFIYPKSSSRELKSWNWIVKLRKRVFQRSRLAQGAARPWRLESDDTTEDDGRVVVDSLDAHVSNFLQSVWEKISTNKSWGDCDMEQHETLMAEYMERFTQPHWAALVELLVEYAGPMSKYNHIQDSVEASASSGSSMVKAVYASHIYLKETPALNTPSMKANLLRKCEILGAIWMYQTLKKAMLTTLEFGYCGSSGDTNEQMGSVADKKDWNVALSALHDIAIFQICGL